MNARQLSRARISSLLGGWTAFVAVLLTAHLFVVVLPLRAQNMPSSGPDPFGGLERRLDSAAEDQLALVKNTRWLTTASVPRSLEITRSTAPGPPRGTSWLLTARRTEFAEQRGESLGADARAILAEEGLPAELLGVSKVESNFNPFAISVRGAAGLWQFMPKTARRYGLRVDALEDERFDVQKSTHAAGRYLRDLYTQFGNWPLALAAYNAGEDAVQRAIHLTSDRNFNSINRAGLLPAETRAYVPAVLKAIGSIERERNASNVRVGMN